MSTTGCSVLDIIWTSWQEPRLGRWGRIPTARNGVAADPLKLSWDWTEEFYPHQILTSQSSKVKWQKFAPAPLSVPLCILFIYVFFFFTCLNFLPHFGHASNSQIRAFIFLTEKGALASHCGLCKRLPKWTISNAITNLLSLFFT